MLASESSARAPAARAEAAFYSNYGWCLDPVLTLRELFLRLEEELERCGAQPLEWQRAECRINVYLFVCAIACTVDDYLARPTRNPARYLRGRLRPLAGPLSAGIEAAHARYAHRVDRAIIEWRRRWDRRVDLACEILTGAEASAAAWEVWRRAGVGTVPAEFPAALLQRRMALPAAFRNQDLTHHDAESLARRCAAAHAQPPTHATVIGLRTAGLYLAPLVSAHLRALGWRSTSWLAIRPSSRALPYCERERLRALDPEARVVLVDEFPRTGHTFRVALRTLATHGVAPERVTVLAPLHPSRPRWTLGESADRVPPVTVVTLEPDELHKARWLTSGAAAEVLREYWGLPASAGIELDAGPATEALNARLQERPRRYSRLKRLYGVRTKEDDGVPITRRVVAKSVGWGWLGYHAYLAATRLAGSVPDVIGLRHGLLWSVWAGGDPGAAAAAPATPQPIPQVAQGPGPEAVGAYVARRAIQLRLTEDPFYDNPDHDLNAWALLLQTLRRAYRFPVNRLKQPVLHRALGRYRAPHPALVDGRMRRQEWVATSQGLVKTDFEQHNFGSGELNVVDPAWDLAGAMFELQLSPEAEVELLGAYVHASGDRTVAARLPLYKLVYGLTAMQDATQDGIGTRDDEELNVRYQTARAFLITQLHRHCATRLVHRPGPASPPRVVCLDLDGVFDADVLGFPHASESGLAALALLHARQYTILLNTARSIADVRHYCRAYGLAGGVAEDGSVWFDAAADRAWPLVDASAAAQLARCRDALRQLPDMFLDPAYQHAIRAFRYRAGETIAPETGELAELFARDGLDQLTFTATLGDAIVTARAVDKGRGLVSAQRYLGCPDAPVAAIGDSARDVPMLRAAELAYAPADCAPAVRALGRQGRCHIMRAPRQRGLLAAVQDLVHRQGTGAGGPDPTLLLRPVGDDLLAAVLRAVERTRLEEWFAGCIPQRL